MASNRSGGRNVHIYSANDRHDPQKQVLGGLILTDGITTSRFFSMLAILLVSDTPYTLENEQGTTIRSTNDPLQPGNYYVVGDSCLVNNEPCLTRTISVATGSRVVGFRDAVRARDGRCVVSGKVVAGAQYGRWRGFEAAHIFPLAYEDHWIRNDYSRWITRHPASGGAINSVQNGLLLKADLHIFFDNYVFSIDPDDNYKIVRFDRDMDDVNNQYLDQRLLNHPERPPDQLFRWHYRQAVLANMRGAGEPVFENDFPSGSDMAGEVRNGPKAAERMEFELFSRLAVHSHSAIDSD